jgi:hypothetical protein
MGGFWIRDSGSWILIFDALRVDVPHSASSSPPGISARVVPSVECQGRRRGDDMETEWCPKFNIVSLCHDESVPVVPPMISRWPVGTHSLTPRTMSIIINRRLVY